MDIRIYLTGRVGVEVRGTLVVDERQFRGRQARLAFANLVLERIRPTPREELARLLWPEDLPPAWEVALSAVVSRLRGLLDCSPLRSLGVSISRGFGQYQLSFPADTWVDLEAGTVALDQAEGALRQGDPRRAFGPAAVAVSIAKRPFLSGDNGGWVTSQRSKLERQRLRALECLSRIWLATGEPVLAVEAATEAVALDSFRESSYQLLMRALDATENRPEALRVYHRLRELLSEELGIDPSHESQAIYLELLR